MRTLFSTVLLIAFFSQPALANRTAYRVCVETCHAWEGQADPKDIRRCIEEYCKRYLMEDLLKKAGFPIDGETMQIEGEEEI